MPLQLKRCPRRLPGTRQYGYGFLPLPLPLPGPETTAGALQDADRPSASVTVQLIVVVPIGNDEPDGGVQLTFSGSTPPDTVGAKVSGVGLLPVESAVG